uniref:DUF2642 domain-containing protein n=1 Tax=Brugia timori TaxID=42155 RepID=A0A0R3Q5E8_9BILA
LIKFKIFRNRQMVNMDIEAIARIEAATKALNVTKNKGYDDIIISESKSFSGSKKEISQKKDNNVMQKKEKPPQQRHEKTEKAIILPATETNNKYSDKLAGRKPTDIRALKRKIIGQFFLIVTQTVKKIISITQVQGQRRKIIEEKDVVVVVPFHEIIIIYE